MFADINILDLIVLLSLKSLQPIRCLGSRQARDRLDDRLANPFQPQKIFFAYFLKNSGTILLILLQKCLFCTVEKDVCTFIILKTDISVLTAFIDN